MTEAQIAAAKSAQAAAREQSRVNQADEQKIKTLMEYTRVTAPFTGVITRRYADTGAMLTQSTQVVRLSQNNLLRLILPVPESAVPTVRIGQQVEVKVPTLILWGTKDTITPANPDAEEFHRRIAGSVYVELPGVGHVAQEEDPTGTLAACKRWLASASSISAALSPPGGKN